MSNKITNEQLLECLAQNNQLITTHGMNDLRSTLKDCGYGSQITPLDIEDVMKIAENLVEKNLARWKHSNWLKITLQGLAETNKKQMVIIGEGIFFMNIQEKITFIHNNKEINYTEFPLIDLKNIYSLILNSPAKKRIAFEIERRS